MHRFVSIDPGTHTGYFIFDICKDNKIIFRECKSVTITQALKLVLEQKKLFGDNFSLILEDARLCRWAGKHGLETHQGVGSIKRDCKIWEDFCLENNIMVWLVNPIKIKNKKLKKAEFEQVFKLYGLKTNPHSRDAIAIGMQYGLLNYMLINNPNFKKSIINYM